MRILPLILCAAFVAACGDSEPGSAEPSKTATPAKPPAEASTGGTKITVRDSEFGRMLWGPGPQAIYIFDQDEPRRSHCYGECAKAWPPVYAKGGPVAGKGVREGLLGTTKRRNGRKQVTYKGQPLYYYAHEEPDEVLCHDVFLNGGYWYVIGPGGKRRP